MNHRISSSEWASCGRNVTRFCLDGVLALHRVPNSYVVGIHLNTGKRKTMYRSLLYRNFLSEKDNAMALMKPTWQA